MAQATASRRLLILTARCRLSEIPQELLDQILEESMVAQGPIYRYICVSIGKPKPVIALHPKFTKLPAIAFVSKLFRSQVLGVLEKSLDYTYQHVVGPDIGAMDGMTSVITQLTGPSLLHADRCSHLTVRFTSTLQTMRWMGEHQDLPLHKQMSVSNPVPPLRTIVEVCLSILKHFPNLATFYIEIRQSDHASSSTVPSPWAQVWKNVQAHVLPPQAPFVTNTELLERLMRIFKVQSRGSRRLNRNAHPATAFRVGATSTDAMAVFGTIAKAISGADAGTAVRTAA